MNIYTEQDKNIRMTWFLMSLFLVIIVGIGWYVSYVENAPIILYIAVAFSLMMNIASYWYSDKVVIFLSGAKEADRDEYLELHRIVENLSITSGLPKPKVYVIQDSSPNAFATGRDKDHAVVAFTTGLLAILEKNELEGVVAHELSHIGNKDILLSTVIVVLVGFVAIISDMFVRGHISGGRSKNGKGSGILVLIGLVFMILSPIFVRLIQLAISRKREFLADASGALLTRYPQGLASALKKISSSAVPLQRQSKAIAHLYISSPLGGSKKVSSFFMTHPPVEERIKALIGDREV